jgi:proteasome accessory factor B
METMRFYQGKHHRLLELDRQIRAGNYPNCTNFAKEWGYTRKTVQRDVTYLRDSLGAPIEYDYHRKGYYYTDSAWQMPGLQLSEGELFLLLTAERMAQQYRGTPLAENLESLYQKIQTALPDKITVDPAYFATERISFQPLQTREISQKVWITLFKALRRNRVTHLTYMKADSEKPEQREVEPLHLACIGGEWYLVAYCHLRNDIRHFALSRMTSVRQTNKSFEPREFDPQEYFRNRFGRFVGEPGREYNVVIRFSKEAAQWVMERTWHPKQKVKKHRDGSVTLSFPVPALYEIKRWVLQWGADAEVLKPKGLRDAVVKEMKAMIGIY